VSVSGSIRDWATTNVNALCYANLPTSNPPSGYRMFINAVPLNGHGVGISNDGSSQDHRLVAGSDSPTGIGRFPVALQPRARKLLNSGQLIDPSNATVILGDSDEPIDAADYNTMYLSYRQSAATNSSQIIPSFHRAALINYIVNFKSLAQYTEQEFWAALRRIELAMMRPLAIDITSANDVPLFMGVPASTRVYRVNPQLSSVGIPVLRMTIPSSWDANILLNTGPNDFQTWVNALLAGPWDVDNTGDGISDSVWMDLGLPLQRTADGKLLKALASFYVEDLDGKIDVNAAGGNAQANWYSEPFSSPIASDLVAQNSLAVSPNLPLPQGVGYGPTEISFRHLLPSTFPGGITADEAYKQLMLARYSPKSAASNGSPGAAMWESPSKLLHLRDFPNRVQAGNIVQLQHRHDRLPGLPVGIRGRETLMLDRMGNPFIHNHSNSTRFASGNEIGIKNNEYEARLISGGYGDSPFDLAEWERIYRWADGDRSSLPSRLQERLGQLDTGLANATLPREITVRSRHLLTPKLASRTRQATDPAPLSFYQLINSVRKFKDASVIADLDPAVFRQLFPLEFSRASSMNLNRPFGNGIDDNNNGEIDEPVEAVMDRPLQATDVENISYKNSIAFDYVQGSTSFDDQLLDNAPTGLQGRQLFARHLYCLAQLIVPDDYAFPNIEPEYWQNLLRDRSNTPDDFKRYLQIRSRILAQWAVNVVDFRDADSSMTRFPYDPDPLDKLNQELESNSATPGWNLRRWSATQSAPVVWGMEQPELLLTESLAFHDLRIRKDPTASPERFDQFRTPEGSLFLELYCPRTTLQGANSGDSAQLPGVSSSLYSNVPGSGDIALNLSKLTPDGRHPVWRLYISEPIDKTTGGRHKTPNQRLLNVPASTTESRFDLTYQLPRSNRPGGTAVSPAGTHSSGLVFDHTGLVRDSRQGAGLDDDNERLPEPNPDEARVIVFVPEQDFQPIRANTPGIAAPDSQVFVNQQSGNNPLYLRGNQYLVVGPRSVTHLGSLTTAKGSPPVNRPSRHRINLSPPTGWPAMFAENGTANGQQFRRAGQGQVVRGAVSMIAAADRPAGWSRPETQNFKVGISVSEPLRSSYYPEPTNRINTNDNGVAPFPGFSSIFDGYHNYTSGAGPTPGTSPQDDGTRGPLQMWERNVTSYSGGSLQKIQVGADENVRDVLQPGTALDWCTAYLQRLADPNKPWNETHNPYITVDWIPVDLTVFSGEEDDNALTPPQPLRLASRQKSGQMVSSKTLQFDPNSQVGECFVSSLTHAPRQSGPGHTSAMLKFAIAGDEGRTQTPRPSTSTGAEFNGNNNTFTTLGFLNSTFVLAAESGIAGLNPPLGPYFGGPADPLMQNAYWNPANLFWTNRSYANSMELGYVPISSPCQIGQEFSATKPTGAANSIYAAAFQNGPPASPSISQGTGHPNAFYKFAHLLNFFQEMPEVLGSFSGTPNPKDLGLAKLFDFVETPSPWVDVQSLQSPELGHQHAVLKPLRPPYNTLPREAEPGRINLNTIAEPNVLKGLYAQTLNAVDRIASVDSADPIWTRFEVSRRGYSSAGLDQDYPTQFAGLFKPTSEAGMVPSTRDSKLDELIRTNPVQATIFRQEANTSPPNPLFRYHPELTATDLPQPHVLHDWLPISRLQKLVTERSNVFAVYVTVGMFEFNEQNGDIGREYGMETGENRRLKAFYVIDRSIPVGYRIGQDHNVEKTIVTRRILAE
jgi:hypothetical protein